MTKGSVTGNPSSGVAAPAGRGAAPPPRPPPPRLCAMTNPLQRTTASEIATFLMKSSITFQTLEGDSSRELQSARAAGLGALHRRNGPEGGITQNQARGNSIVWMIERVGRGRSYPLLHVCRNRNRAKHRQEH